MCKHAVSARKVDHATATEEAPYASSCLPGFVQLLARQAARITHHAREPIEERVAREPPKIVRREPLT